jgi:hypothetical protein
MTDQAGRGYVYILTNPAFPDRIKIGKTAKHPDARAGELSRGTAVPAPYEVLWHARVKNYSEVERLVQMELLPFRTRGDREFYMVAAENAVAVASRVAAPYTCNDQAEVGVSSGDMPPLAASPLPRELTVPRSRGAAQSQGKRAFWSEVAATFRGIGGALSDRCEGSKEDKDDFCQLACGLPSTHYEWLMNCTDETMDVALHFESARREANLARMEALKARAGAIEQGVELALFWGPRRRKWAQVRFQMPYRNTYANRDGIRQACSLMRALVDRTLPLLRSMEAE